VPESAASAAADSSLAVEAYPEPRAPCTAPPQHKGHKRPKPLITQPATVDAATRGAGASDAAAAELRDAQVRSAQLHDLATGTVTPSEVEFRAIWSYLFKLSDRCNADASASTGSGLPAGDTTLTTKMSELKSDVEDLRDKSGAALMAHAKTTEDRDRNIARILGSLQAQVNALESYVVNLAEDLMQTRQRITALGLDDASAPGRFTAVEDAVAAILGLKDGEHIGEAVKHISTGKESKQRLPSVPYRDLELQSVRERLLSIRDSLASCASLATSEQCQSVCDELPATELSPRVHAQLLDQFERVETEEQGDTAAVVLPRTEPDASQICDDTLQQDDGGKENPVLPIPLSTRAKKSRLKRLSKEDRAPIIPETDKSQDKSISPLPGDLHTPLRVAGRTPLNCIWTSEDTVDPSGLIMALSQNGSKSHADSLHSLGMSLEDRTAHRPRQECFVKLRKSIRMAFAWS